MILEKAMPDASTNYENITLHHIRKLHLGAIVLNIINISVTVKNGSFLINMAIHCHIVNLAMSLFGPNDNT